MPQISHIKFSDIKEAHRYDAEYFKPEYFDLRKKLKNLNSRKLLDYLSIGKIVTGHTPFMANEAYYGGTVKFIKTGNLRENHIKEDFNHYLSDIGNKTLKRTELKENDILVTIIGATEDVVGRVCIVNKEILPANINQNIALIRVDDRKINPHFLNIYLNSRYGRRYLHSLSRQTEQVNLNCREVEQLLIPNYDPSFQLQIEQIVKSAYQKQTQSKQLYREAEQLLLAELGLLDYEIKQSLWFTTTKNEVSEAHRYDSEYFQPKYAEIIKKIEEYEGGWDLVKNQFNQNTTLSKKEGEYCNYIEISDVNTSNGEITPNKIETKDIPANGKRKLFLNDLLISKVRPYRGAISFIDFEVDNLLGSGAFTVLQEKTEYKKEVLMMFLKTQFIKDLLLRYNCGTSYPVIKDEDILNLKIPLIKQSIQKQIAEKIQESHKLRKESKKLLEEAKRKVEEEIEK